MKNGKKPTVAQAKILTENGFDYGKWFIVRTWSDKLEIIEKNSSSKETQIVHIKS